ncbi:MAG: radical SAM protein [Acidobacteriota bacterium]|nr:radical SAM protein [Acidobacteriota bacterium]MDQ7088664.1 radical SAM protein [Acidobacteriota bacterium]
MTAGWPIAYVEPVFRPPSEAESLILQLTVGCSWNRCTFCAMYRGKRYRVRSVREVVEEIRAAARRTAPRKVFLADGDALAAPPNRLEEILETIRAELPSVGRVGIYGDSRAILRCGAEGLRRLAERGLGIVYFGAESGDDATLRAIRKGATAARQLEASKLVLEAGIKLSVMVLVGLGGKAGSRRHAEATGRFLVAASPTYAAALTLTPVPSSPLYEAWKAGEFELPDRWGMLEEVRVLLTSMEGYRGLFHANHASNYLPLRLRLPRDRQPALALLDRVLERRDPSLLVPDSARGL